MINRPKKKLPTSNFFRCSYHDYKLIAYFVSVIFAFLLIATVSAQEVINKLGMAPNPCIFLWIKTSSELLRQTILVAKHAFMTIVHEE